MDLKYNDLKHLSEKMVSNFVEAIKKRAYKDPNYFDKASESIFNQAVDDITLEIVGEYHRALVKGYADYVYNSPNTSNSFGSSTKDTEWNELAETKVEDIKCPKCYYMVNASKFAPHLEKCMGIGRGSARIASRRIALNSKESSYAPVSDAEDDDDWNASTNKKTIKIRSEPKKKRDSSRKQKSLKEMNKGKSLLRSKDEAVEWTNTSKFQLSPAASSRIKKTTQELDTEGDDVSTTPSPADSNSTSSGSVSKRKERVKSKKKGTKSSRYSDDPDCVLFRG